MRFAFLLAATVGNIMSVELYDAAEASNSRPHPLATLIFTNDNGKMVYDGLNISGAVRKSDQLTIRKLARVFASAEEEELACTKQKEARYSPLFIARALVSERNVQIVFDPSAKRFRCCTTMTEGANVYELLGTGGLTVEAKDEEHAVRLGKREVTEQMQEHPDTAGKLVAFFTGGCKVKEQASGKLPDFVQVASLAQGPAEIKLAATPIKLAMPAKDEE